MHCPVCIRECERGQSFCHRRDEQGNLKQAYRFCSKAVDYLFDKPINHFGENARVLSLGSWGCNFRCLGCQNVNLSWSVDGANLGFIEMTPEDVVVQALESGCKGICYSYNEPAILLEMVEAVAQKAREKNLFNVFITNSTLSENSVRRLAVYIDAVAADIKSLNDSFYYEYCGAAGIPQVSGKILNCIKTFSDCGCHVEIRTNIIPGGNDNVENYHRIASWINDNLGPATPWHITRFFPAHKLSHIPATPELSMLKARDVGIEEGLRYVHTYLEKGCDCAREIDLVGSNKTVEMHDCCRGGHNLSQV